MKGRLFVLLQHLIPHHLPSRVMWKLARSKNRTLKSLLIGFVATRFNINLEEAENSELGSYETFNQFFTRALKEDARPLPTANDAVLSPADGMVSQSGEISNGRIFQAKGKDFGVTELLGGDTELGKQFLGGKFATIYLSPKDYHRLHMPITGKLTKMVHVPGRLFSVNPTTVEGVPGLFARNERVVALFETESGPMALILVGAIFVSSIETVWHGEVTPPTTTTVQFWDYSDQDKPVVLQKGEEMGRFNMGSTIIVLFGKNQIDWSDELVSEAGVKVKSQIGTETSVSKQSNEIDQVVDNLLDNH